MSEPRASRPQFAGYGISTEPEGMLSWSWAEERLVAARNYWIATASAERGPHTTPIWGLWRDGGLVFSCGSTSRKARDIAADSRVVVHLESGDDVVIVEGDATGTAATDEIVDAYSAKYMPFDAEIGDWFFVRPRRAFRVAGGVVSEERDALRLEEGSAE